MPFLNPMLWDEELREVWSSPYRLLEEIRNLLVGDLKAGNMLIHGIILQAPSSLLPFHVRRVK